MKKELIVKKLKHEGAPKLKYYFDDIFLNDLLGKKISIRFLDKKECIHCGRSIKKTFNQGYCFPCFQSLARCDMCILKPELCHYSKGTCREPKWGEKNCLIDHIVYLANTTGLKIGITREHKILERWGDQGALQAIKLMKVSERYVAGLAEVELKSGINDKTNWRSLITGKTETVDLELAKKEARFLLSDEFQEDFLEDDNEIYTFEYPIISYPEKAKTHNFDKEAELTGELTGIRGQYLFVGGVAVNIRKFQGYWVEVEI